MSPPSWRGRSRAAGLIARVPSLAVKVSHAMAACTRGSFTPTSRYRSPRPALDRLGQAEAAREPSHRWAGSQSGGRAPPAAKQHRSGSGSPAPQGAPPRIHPITACDFPYCGSTDPGPPLDQVHELQEPVTLLGSSVTYPRHLVHRENRGARDFAPFPTSRLPVLIANRPC